MRVFLDSCVVIYLVESSSPLHEATRAAFSAAPSDAEFCTSDLVRLECRVGPLRTGDTVRVALFDRFFSSIEIVPLTAAAHDLAANIRAQHGV
jgi:predicted nucleic acid-binding protein